MNKMLYRISLALMALLLVVGAQSIATAQQSNDRDTTQAQVKAFEEFLEAHPAMAPELRKNPSLVNDAGYVNNHPELATFLQGHPKLAEELKENPSAFMAAEEKVQKGENPSGEGEIQLQREQALDQFLDSHPAIAKDLQKNPSLVNDPSYLKNHRQLSVFLENHPHIKAALAQNPGAYLNAAERSDRDAQPRNHKDDKDKDKDQDHR